MHRYHCNTYRSSILFYRVWTSISPGWLSVCQIIARMRWIGFQFCNIFASFFTLPLTYVLKKKTIAPVAFIREFTELINKYTMYPWSLQANLSMGGSVHLCYTPLQALFSYINSVTFDLEPFDLDPVTFDLDPSDLWPWPQWPLTSELTVLCLYKVTRWC